MPDIADQDGREPRKRTMASFRLRNSSAMPVTSPTSVNCLMEATQAEQRGLAF